MHARGFGELQERTVSSRRVYMEELPSLCRIGCALLDEPSQEEIEADRNSLEQFKTSRGPNQTRLLQTTITILVYWHKIIGAGGVGAVSDAEIAYSVLVLKNTPSLLLAFFSIWSRQTRPPMMPRTMSYQIPTKSRPSRLLSNKAPWRP